MDHRLKAYDPAQRRPERSAVPQVAGGREKNIVAASAADMKKDIMAKSAADMEKDAHFQSNDPAQRGSPKA